MKLASDEEMLEVANLAREICLGWGCRFIVNDRVGVALGAEADGVHLGKEDMAVSEARRILGPDAIIGGTANTVEDVRKHWREGADYIGLGPYRFTATKKNLSPILGLEGYRRILQELKKEGFRLPVFAIGGIGSDDVAALVEAGCSGVAFSGMLVNTLIC